jgi:hypothetical protein
MGVGGSRHNPAPLPSGKGPGTCRIGGWMGPILVSTLWVQFVVEKSLLVECCFFRDNLGFNITRTSCSICYNLWLCKLAYHGEGWNKLNGAWEESVKERIGTKWEEVSWGRRKSLKKFIISTYIPCSILILSKFFNSPTDAQMNFLKNNFKIYIKIYIKTAPTRFGAVTPSSGSALFVLAKVTAVQIAN